MKEYLVETRVAAILPKEQHYPTYAHAQVKIDLSIRRQAPRDIRDAIEKIVHQLVMMLQNLSGQEQSIVDQKETDQYWESCSDFNS